MQTNRKLVKKELKGLINKILPKKIIIGFSYKDINPKSFISYQTEPEKIETETEFYDRFKNRGCL